MARAHPQAAPRDATPPIRRGVVSGALVTLGALPGAIALALAVSIAVEWTGLWWGWWPATHARDLLLRERVFVEAIDDYPLSPLRPVELTGLAWGYLDQLVAWTGFAAHSGVYAVAAINTGKLLVLRLVIVGLALPGYALAMLAGLFEGLVARDIRKFTGGHESAYVFHKAKRWVVPSIALSVTVYLMLPFALPPLLVFAPTMGLAAVMVYIATSRFKKFV